MPGLAPECLAPLTWGWGGAWEAALSPAPRDSAGVPGAWAPGRAAPRPAGRGACGLAARPPCPVCRPHPGGVGGSPAARVCPLALSVCYKAGAGADTAEEGKGPVGACVAGRGPAGGRLTPGPSGEMEEELENPEVVDLPEKLKHQLRHRELFLSRQLESLPATHIR